MFELHITCSKDFDSLNIQFSDGSVGTFSGVEKTPKSDRSDRTNMTEKVKKIENASKHEKSERTEKVVKPEKVPENFLDHFEKPKNTNSCDMPEIPDITEVSVDPDLNDLEI